MHVSALAADGLTCANEILPEALRVIRTAAADNEMKITEAVFMKPFVTVFQRDGALFLRPLDD